MKTVTIPSSDLSPAQICLGTNHFGTDVPASVAVDLLDFYTAAGGNFIDTAHIYADWIPGTKSVSEKTIGKWMADRKNRHRLIIATKGGHPPLETPHISRLSRQDLYFDVEESLRFLQTDYIDLYWLHRDDPGMPVGDMLDTLNDLVTSGKIRYFGCSNWHVTRMAEANAYAAAHQLRGFIANQPNWSLAVLNDGAVADKTLVEMDQAAITYHRQTGLAAIPYSSQAKGFFQKQPDRLKPRDRELYWNEINLRRAEKVIHLAGKYGVSISAIVLGYLTGQPFVTIPVIGTRNVVQLQDSLRAAEVDLTAEDVAFLADDRLHLPS